MVVSMMMATLKSILLSFLRGKESLSCACSAMVNYKDHKQCKVCHFIGDSAKLHNLLGVVLVIV